MNNSRLIENSLEEEQVVDIKPILREKASKLAEVIEALSALSQSSYWEVLRQHEFDGDLLSLAGQLEKEDHTVKIYRLQGEIRRAKKYDLTSLLAQRRVELEAIKKKLI